jgi:hypothetical protein
MAGNIGPPPLFGAPWEREDAEAEERIQAGERRLSDRDSFFVGMNRNGIDWAAKQISELTGMDSQTAGSFATAMSVMEHRQQTRVANDIYDYLRRIGQFTKAR